MNRFLMRLAAGAALTAATVAAAIAASTPGYADPSILAEHRAPGRERGHQVADGHPRRRRHAILDHRRGPLRDGRRGPRRDRESQGRVQVRRTRLRPGGAGPDRGRHPQDHPRGPVAMCDWIKDIITGLVNTVL